MKIKTDFVTNSSSTSYVMISSVSGMLPVFNVNFKDKLSIEDGGGFIYKDYAHVWQRLEQNDNFEIHYGGPPQLNYDLILNNTTEYSEDLGIPIAVTCMVLNTEELNPFGRKHEDVIVSLLEEILFHKLGVNLPACQMVYVAKPDKIQGAGWDGGDSSMGPSEYGYTHEVLAAESKLGILNIIGKKIIPELGDIKSAVSLNEILLKNINNSGLILEEQNDKDS